ncbi:MAG: hypothetical protein ACI8W8_004182, partial [Rhodothermales bacterium]
GPDFWYRFSAKAPVPSSHITATADQVTIKAGESADLKLTITRLHGHDATLSIAADRLPVGIKLELPEIPKKTGDLTVKLIADAQAPEASAELRLSLHEGEQSSPIPYSFQAADSRGEFLINEGRPLWITVVRPAK